MAKTIPIDWEALETAVERNAPDTESFLDSASGQVVTIVAGDPEAQLQRQRVAENIHSHLRVEPASSREQYRWMEKFVASVSEPALRERLIISIDGKGAFRRFKDVLLAYPAERERWFSYRADLLHWHIHSWLEEHDLAAATEPPWGGPKPPPELPEVEGQPVVHGTEPPGEALRRQARDLIDSIAAIELPSAIAFLEFLRERGTSALQSEKSEKSEQSEQSEHSEHSEHSDPAERHDDEATKPLQHLASSAPAKEANSVRIDCEPQARQGGVRIAAQRPCGREQRLGATTPNGAVDRSQDDAVFRRRLRLGYSSPSTATSPRGARDGSRRGSGCIQSAGSLAGRVCCAAACAPARACDHPCGDCRDRMRRRCFPSWFDRPERAD